MPAFPPPPFAQDFGAPAVIQSRADDDPEGRKVNIICAWAVSGQYGPGTRILFYILVAGCVLARKKPWLRNVCLAAALVVSAVAAMHGIVLAILHTPGAVDMDIYGALQFSSIAILAAPVTVRISNTYFLDPGRNIIFLWTGLLLAGLMSMAVEFFRIKPTECKINYPDGDFPYSTGDKCGLACSVKGPSSPIRRGTTNDIQVVPVPVRIPISMAILISAGCCVPAVLMLVSTWLKIREMNRQRQDENEREKSLNEVIEGTNGATMRRMNGINENIRELLRVVELAVFTAAIIALLVIGERNFFSRELYEYAEPMTSVGQWGPIVGTVLAAIGSLYVVLAKDIARRLKGSGDEQSVSDGDGCTCSCSRHGSHRQSRDRFGWPQQAPGAADAVSVDDNFADSSYPDSQNHSGEGGRIISARSGDGDTGDAEAASMPRPQQQARPGSTIGGSRGKVYSIFSAVNRFLGTAQGQYGMSRDGLVAQYPTIPGEEIRNPALTRTRNTWKKQAERSRSNSCNTSIMSTSPIEEDPRSSDSPPEPSTPRRSQSSFTMSPANATTSAGMQRLSPTGSFPAGGHLQVPGRSFRSGTRRSTSPSISKPVILDGIPGRRRPAKAPAIAITQAVKSSTNSLSMPMVEAGPSTA